MLTLLVAFVVSSQSPMQDSLFQERVVGRLGAQLDSALTRLESYGFSGTVLVVRRRRIALLKGYGMAIVERRVRNTPATRFAMGKAFLPGSVNGVVRGDAASPLDTLFAHGYIGTPAGLEPGPRPRGAGGLWARVGDVYRYLITERPPVPFLRSGGQGVRKGWLVTARSDTTRARVEKRAGSAAFASQLLYYPEAGVVIIWASNNLRQRWRHTVNHVLQAIAFGARAPLPPRVERYPVSRLMSYAGKYLAGGDTLELRAGPTYLYAAPNKLRVPTDLIFLPQTKGRFAGFDPATGTVTRLEVQGATITVNLADGERIAARR